MLMDFVRRTSFVGIPPLQKEVSSTIEAAKKLERLVDSDVTVLTANSV